MTTRNGESMDQGTAAAVASEVVKASPAVGANAWLWLTHHDINWFVALATLIYIGLQAYVLVRDRIFRDEREPRRRARAKTAS